MSSNALSSIFNGPSLLTRKLAPAMTEKFVERRTLTGLLSAEAASEANQACQRALEKQPEAKVRGFEGKAAEFVRIYAVKTSTAEAAGTAMTGVAEMLSRLKAEGDAELVLFETHDAKDVCVMFTDLSIKRLVASFVIPNKSVAVVWDVIPNEGLGQLRFGRSRAEVRAQLGPGFKSFKKTPAARALTDAYNDLGLHLYYDREDCLELIEAFPPCQPRLGAVELLGEDLAAVIRGLNQANYQSRAEGGSYFFEDAGLALYAPGGSVEGVSVCRRGYFGASRTSDE